MLKQVKGLDHHLWVPKTNMAFLPISHLWHVEYCGLWFLVYTFTSYTKQITH